MNLTTPSLGYHEILQCATAQSGGLNVLIGYSEGGTVARYLALVDEQIAKPEKRCIHSVITVQGPTVVTSCVAGKSSGGLARHHRYHPVTAAVAPTRVSRLGPLEVSYFESAECFVSAVHQLASWRPADVLARLEDLAFWGNGVPFAHLRFELLQAHIDLQVGKIRRRCD
jgi:hypothetical protein